MIQKLQQLLGMKNEYDEPSRNIIDNLVKSSKDLETIEEMKKTEGWQIIETSLKVNLHNRIYEKTKDDPQIISILSLLSLTDTKNIMQRLDLEIDQFIN